MQKTQSLTKQFVFLAIDVVVTVLISATIAIVLLSVSVSGKELFNSSAEVSLRSYLAEVLPLTSDSILLQRTEMPFLSISFYTTFITSVWIWLYAFSGFLLKGFALWEVAKERVKLDERPLSYLGAVSILILTTCCLFVWSAGRVE